jgi:hypothetical protein
VIAGAAFYGFSPVLIPYNQPHPALIKLLIETGADSLIAQAGSLPLADVGKGVPGLRQVIWTVEKTSRHMDWNEVPEGIGGKIDVSVWHELVQDQKTGSNAELPQNESGPKPGNLIFVWQEKPGKEADIVEFSQNVSFDTFELAISSLTSCYTERCGSDWRTDFLAPGRPSYDSF